MRVCCDLLERICPLVDVELDYCYFLLCSRFCGLDCGVNEWDIMTHILLFSDPVCPLYTCTFASGVLCYTAHEGSMFFKNMVYHLLECVVS
jgi:hypothetical protein